MKLLVNYKGINKIMQNVDSFEDIVKFVKQSFFLKMSKWSLYYIDSEDDEISLDSEVDYNTLIETSEKDYIKIYVVDKQDSEEVENVDDKKINVEEVSEVKDKKETFVNKEQVTAVENAIPLAQNIFPLLKETVEEKNEGLPQESKENQQGRSEGMENHREQWRKKVEEKMAKFFDDRLEAMMPCIIKRVEEQMKNSKPKENKKEGVEHNVKCNGCGIQPIVGICYRSTKIASFNFCENCEKEVEHEHNMIKMKKPEEEVEEKMNDDHCKRFWWKKHWSQACDEKESQMPAECKGRWANWDPRVSLTKKCFKLRSNFGGMPEDYEKLVEENPKARVDELVKVYLESHPEKNNEFEFNERAKECILKLEFYFKETAFDFTDVVKNNPFSNLKQLISIVKETKLLENRDNTKQLKNEIMKKGEEKEKVVAHENSIHPQKIKPVEQRIDGQAMIKKRNDFVLHMKGLFGHDGMIEYISFFNSNNHKPLDEIIKSFMEAKYQ